ncbi:hypothetical protein GCM10009084_13010 [Marinomonas primoryensis]
MENLAMFELCKKLGFDLFQGYFFQRPEIIKGRKINSTARSAIALVNTLQNQNVTIEEVTRLATNELKLSYQLLRILNSPVCDIKKTVVSIQEAVVFIGLNQLKKWALLITLCSSTKSPQPLLKVLLTRGRYCQLLAESKQSERGDSAFMVGLLSSIEVVFNLEKSIVLDEIALDKGLYDAIMNQSGELGTYLTQTLNFEAQNWRYLDALKVDERTTLNKAFLEAMVWTDVMISGVKLINTIVPNFVTLETAGVDLN